MNMIFNIKTLIYSGMLLLCGTPAFSQDTLLIQNNRGKCGLKVFDASHLYGKCLVPAKFQAIRPFQEKRAPIKYKGKWGYIDNYGNIVIPCQYDEAQLFSEGKAAVKKYGKWGYIDNIGKNILAFRYNRAGVFSNGLAEVEEKGNKFFINQYGQQFSSRTLFYTPTFSEYAKTRVEAIVNEWQKKRKYEKTIDWQARVNERTREELIRKLTAEAEREYIEEQGNKVNISLNIVDYDADNEVFLIQDKRFGPLLVPVPIRDAPSFERNFSSLSRNLKYFVECDTLALAELVFTNSAGKSFLYSNQASLNYTISKIDYKFAPVEIDPAATENIRRGQQNIREVASSVGRSDIDLNIPVGNTKQKNTFVVIIANENYRNESGVPYARSDGETFRKYCVQTLGIAEDRIHFRADATLNEIRQELNWLRNVGTGFGRDAKVLFYYSGHGMPDEKNGTSYLLPVDGSARDLESGFGISKLYDQLGALPVESVTVFLDACFSGTTRGGEMLYATKGIERVAAREAVPQKGRLVVLSASKGNETALLYDEKGHGMFTYFLLKKIQETKGNVTLGELADFVGKKVFQESIVANGKSQTPTVQYSPDLGPDWKDIKLSTK